MVASTRHGPFECGVTVAVTLGSAEVDTRADGAIQVVGEPSDPAPDGTIEIHLVHPIERCVRKMSKVPSQESSAEKAVGAECAVAPATHPFMSAVRPTATLNLNGLVAALKL